MSDRDRFRAELAAKAAAEGLTCGQVFGRPKQAITPERRGALRALEQLSRELASADAELMRQAFKSADATRHLIGAERRGLATALHAIDRAIADIRTGNR